MIFRKLLTLLFISALLFGCRQDIDTDITDLQTITFPSEKITASLFGQVVDQSGDYVQDAQVSIGNYTRNSDEDGMVYFKDIEMNARGTYIKIEKEGFLLGAKMINPRENKTSYIKAKLIEKQLLGQITAAQGGTVTTSDNANITLPANGIKDQSGNAYSGTVNVYGAWLNPSAEDIFEIMPGDLRAVDQEGDFKQLATFGMIGVELESESGEALQIMDGHKATIEMPVPDDLADQAPASIPLWHFDENNGYWIEEGVAQLENGKYNGQVAHFSFWNCDYPYDWVNMTGSITTSSGTGIYGLQVSIQIAPNGSTGYGYTDNEGVFGGIIPGNENLILTVYDPNCEEVVYTAEVGPFNEDVTLEPIILELADLNLFAVTASWVDCQGAPVIGGYAQVKIGNLNYYSPMDETGSTSFLVSECETGDGNIRGFDLLNAKQSAYHNFPSGSPQDLGTLEICDELSEYIILELNGNQFTIPDPSMSGFMGRLALSGYATTGPLSYGMDLVFPSDVAGTYIPDSLMLGVSHNGVIIFTGECGVTASCGEASHSGIVPQGEIVTGDFTATIDDTLNVNGIFKVIME